MVKGRSTVGIPSQETWVVEAEPTILTVTTAVAWAAHRIPIAALLPPAAVEAPRWGVVRAVAVATHAALLITAAWIHLAKTMCSS